MKNLIKIAIGFCLVISIVSNVSAQDPNMVELKSYYAKMKDFTTNSFTSGKTSYFDYSVTMIPLHKKDKEQHANMKMWVNNKDIKMLSDKMQVFKNEKEVLTILPSAHLIVLSDAVPLSKENSQKSMLWMKLQDTLFQMSHIQECSAYQDKNGEAMKRIKLVLNDEGKRLFKFNSIEFKISEQAKEIREMKITYDPQNGRDLDGMAFAAMDISVQSIRLTAAGSIFPNNIEALVFNSDRSLKADYKGYSIKDNRVRAKNNNG